MCVCDIIFLQRLLKLLSWRMLIELMLGGGDTDTDKSLELDIGDNIRDRVTRLLGQY